MLGLGQDGHFSLYPHIQRAIGGVPNLSQTERELLWRAFRRAMLKLGIQPLARRSGAHFMADEYVRQAGVPIAFADDLANRMLQVARRIGLPDEDDQESLLAWQASLLNKLAPPFSVTAKKAVGRDTTAYYTRTFVRVHTNSGQASNKDPLELAFATAFSKESSFFSRRTAIPHLQYRDGTLRILFPPSPSSASYRIVFGESSQTVSVDTHGAYRPLPSVLSPELIVLREDGERVLNVKLWPDTLPNRLLIFNYDGRLRATAQLNQDEPVELPAGRYIALCRFEPSNLDDWTAVNTRPLLVEVPFELRPGNEQLLKNGPAVVILVGENKPTFTLKGPVRSSLERTEFWYGHLDAKIDVPSEWHELGGTIFQIRVMEGDRRMTVPAVLDESGQATVSLTAAIEGLQTPPGMRRIVVEMVQGGESRTLHRQSVLYWIGLKEVTSQFQFSYATPPCNLFLSHCKGVKVAETHAGPSDDQGSFIRMAFDLGSNRIVRFSWHRPGVFVEVQVVSKDGACMQFARAVGSAETVSLTSNKTVTVIASEPGYITLGSMRTFVDFSKTASKSYPASFLASRLEPGARTLKYESHSSRVSLDLLFLSQPHVASEIKTERLANLVIVRIKIHGEPTEISISGRELASGHQTTAEHQLMAGTWHTNDLARMQAYSSGGGNTHEIHLLIDIETLSQGTWLVSFGACIGGIWGALQDEREKRIAVALTVDESGSEISGKNVIAQVGELELTEVISRLARLNEHFKYLWSPICWDQQSWLPAYFSALVDRLRDSEHSYVTELFDIATAITPDDVPTGHISMQCVPASLSRIFALHRAIYKRVNLKAHPLSVALRAMQELHGPVSPAFGKVLHPAAAMGFKNVAQIMHGSRPKLFNLLTYRDVLQQSTLEGGFQLDDETFLPGAGELLGPLHLAHAWREIERRFNASQLMPSSRQSAAVAVAKSLHRLTPSFGQDAPVGLRGQSLLILLANPKHDEVDAEELLTREHMSYVVQACAWLAWYCRLESRHQGALDTFHTKLGASRKAVEISGASITDCIAYYLQVAPAIFSFYLLLWELVLTIQTDPVIENV